MTTFGIAFYQTNLSPDIAMVKKNCVSDGRRYVLLPSCPVIQYCYKVNVDDVDTNDPCCAQL